MTDEVGRLTESHELLDEKWKEGGKFLELMILDMCFVLEILRVFTFDLSLGYGDWDPVFGGWGRTTIVSNLVEDCLLLENQLPFQVFEILLALENRSSIDPGVFMDSALSIIGGNLNNTESILSKLRTVDLLRNKIIGKPYGRPPRVIDRIGIRSATTYRKAGIAFARSNTNFLTDIKLKNNVLRLPVFKLFTMSQTIWLNVLAFERLHAGLTQNISAYICVMARLLQTAEDVQLFQSSGLISVSTFGEVEEILALIKTLYENVDFRVSSNLLEAIMELNEFHCRSTKKWKRRIREWSSNFKQTYFKSPWSVMSLIVAALLIALTFGSTQSLLITKHLADFLRPDLKVFFFPHFDFLYLMS